jgi:uncharacterized damage-inducible protein DinB
VAANELLIDGFGRIREIVHDVLDGLTADDLAYRPDPGANSIGWLIWHLTRVQDDHIAGAGDLEQVWLTGGWEKQSGLPLDPEDTGYGHGSDQVAAVLLAAELLAAYHDAACEQTIEFVSKLTEADLRTVVDRRWDPPVTMGVRLVSVLSDDLQHAGQAAFIRGMLERRG